MHLTDLVSDTITPAGLQTDKAATPAIDVSGLAVDSRRVVAGDLFFALDGNHADGRDYADAAIKSGAVAISAAFHWAGIIGVDFSGISRASRCDMPRRSR